MLRIDVDPANASDVAVLVRGELDITGAARLRETITALLNTGEARTVRLDLRGLTFIDSTGIGTLVVAQRICAQVGVRLHVTAISPFAARVLTLTGVIEALVDHQQ